MNLTVRGVLLDIEGTTSALDYVHRTLFPYARAEVEGFLQRHWTRADVVAARAQIACAGDLAEVLAEVGRLMDADAKATGLKALQGLIWQEGYAAGRLRSHVYPDVPPALEKWVGQGLDVRIYSSGSVTAQKVFFAHTDAGDLTRFLSGNYDTTTGPKREAESYRKIAADFGLAPAAILFLSDVVAELDAARVAGMQTALLLRPGNTPVAPGHGHPELAEFASLDLG